VAVQVIVPQMAQALLGRPFELARFADGTPFAAAGVRFVYQLEGTPTQAEAKEPVEPALRILAAFSLPVRANPLDLRRDRCGLQRLVRDLTRTQGLTVELCVLQYSATRNTLREPLEGERWDVIYPSGHGDRGELLLEDERGGSDPVDAGALGDLLDPVRGWLYRYEWHQRGQPARGRGGGAVGGAAAPAQRHREHQRAGCPTVRHRPPRPAAGGERAGCR
jgi:hypothetical protein